MGILPAIKREGYDVKELRLVDSSGRRVGGFSADVFACPENKWRALRCATTARCSYSFGLSIDAAGALFFARALPKQAFAERVVIVKKS